VSQRRNPGKPHIFKLRLLPTQKSACEAEWSTRSVEKKQPGPGPGCSISIYPEQLVSATKQVVDAKTRAIDIVLE
jgi:hypothetical protein